MTYRYIDKEKLMESLFHDREILAEVVEAFRGDTGRVAGQARQAMEFEDPELMARSMHALKGIFASVADFEDAREAGLLEKRCRAEDPCWEECRKMMDCAPDVEKELDRLLEETPSA